MANTITPISETLKEYGRGIAGGLLFSLPMLYTMELWWAGFILKPLELLIYLIVGLFLLYVYNKYAGLSDSNDMWQNIFESLEEFGLALMLTTLILYLTGRIGWEMSFNDIGGKVLVESVTVAIGISVGKKQLGADNDKNQEQQSKTGGFRRSFNLALCGAILVASNIAPTDEVAVIGLESGPFKILLIALLSVGIGAAILYYINFVGTKRRGLVGSNSKEIIFGTLIMYTISLGSSAFMLWFFGRFSGVSFHGVVAQTIVLAFPASLGASAGRFLIQD